MIMKVLKNILKRYIIAIQKLFMKYANFFFEFKNPINENEIDGFFDEFIKNSAEKKTYSNFINGINLIKNYETFIKVINKNKEIIIQMYTNSENKKEKTFSPIKLEDNLEIIKKNNS